MIAFLLFISLLLLYYAFGERPVCIAGPSHILLLVEYQGLFNVATLSVYFASYTIAQPVSGPINAHDVECPWVRF